MQDGQELVELLRALGSDQKQIRNAAEATLAETQLKAGFPALLISFIVTTQTAEAFHLRQMAITIIKRLIKEHWTKLNPQDQVAIRSSLLAGIADPTPNIQLLLHVCIRHAAPYNGGWPELAQRIQQGLVQGPISDTESCVRCLSTVAEDSGTEVVKSLAPLCGHLLGLCTAPATPLKLRGECIAAHAACACALLDAEEDQIAAAVSESLPAWLSVHAEICRGGDGTVEHVDAAFAAVRAVNMLCRRRGCETVLAQALEGILAPVCLLVQRSAPMYEAHINGTGTSGTEDDKDGPLPSLVMQVMELLQTLLLRKNLRKLMKGRLRQLLQLFVPFMRITASQEQEWHDDPNEFLINEEDDHGSCTVRLSGEGLIGELHEHYPKEALREIANYTLELLERGKQDWKFEELALLVFGLVAAELPAKKLQGKLLCQPCEHILRVASRACTDKSTPEFLRARGFSLFWRLGEAVPELCAGDLPQLLGYCAAALNPSEPLTVRICACKALCRQLPMIRNPADRSQLLLNGGVLTSLGSLLHESSEEVIHLVLESLTVIVKACPEAVVTIRDSFTPLIVQAWQKSVTDPMINAEVMDLISCAAFHNPVLRGDLEMGLSPVVESLLQGAVLPNAGTECPEAHVVAAAIDLYGVIVKRAEIPFPEHVWKCVNKLFAVTLSSEDNMVLQNACDPICSIVKRTPGQLMEAGLLPQLLQALERLLSGNLEEDACVFVGPVISLLIAHFGSKLSPELTAGLLRAVVGRLARSQRPIVRQSLIVVLARLMHENLDGVISILHAVEVPVADKLCTGLELLLSVWLQNANQIRSRTSRNIAFSALVLLHRAAETGDSRLLAIRMRDSLPKRLLEVIGEALEYENECWKKEHIASAKSLKNAAKQQLDDDGSDADSDENDTVGAGGTYESVLDDLAALEDDSDDDDAGDTFQEVERQDPLSKLDLREYLAAHLEGLLAKGPQLVADEAQCRQLSAAVAAARCKATHGGYA
eukprot:gnl/MRDRNA2_/MRDRNA2_117600_c0_seq1.p1 gnl/MRDRNA2_/MRDRNA2_117600_c0~~gnl/MRDRNA2_/MRDRNA2_117600_c0_seq1.p1  ORF type:complete len:993 (+),score=202.08 gnl/MRDRNA2_/MRDRNA2_117600_c0_seq1:126-3104(+)